MLKKICSIGLIIIIFLSLNIGALAVDNTSSTTAMRMQPLIDKLQGLSPGDIQDGINKYSDAKKHWAKDYIGKLTQLGVIGGGVKGRFNPDGEMSVAGFIKTVTLALGYKIVQSVKPGTNWYDSYIAQAKKDKLIDDGDFKDYTKAITREQASKVLYRAAMMFEPAPENQGELNVMKFRIKDHARIGDKYKDTFVRAYYMGYFTLGSSETCNPQGTFTRAQACTVVIRLLDARERTAFKIKEGEYYISSYDGSKLYPSGSLESVHIINFIDKNLHKSKGYVERIVLGGGGSYNFFESEEEFETANVTGIDLGIDINDTGSPVDNNWCFTAWVFNSEVTKEKHLDLLGELIKFYFEDKADDAMAYVNKVLSYGGAEYLKEYKIKDRYLVIHYVSDTGISIDITCKGGLTRAEYMKKYPNG